MKRLPNAESPELDELWRAIRSEETVSRIASQVVADAGTVRDRVEMALAESAQTLRVLDGCEVADGARLLEIGAGLGITAIVLSRAGLEVTALEPSGPGFEDQQRLAVALADALGSSHHVLTIEAERLDPAVHGLFDLIYSNNVLEHVGDPQAALASMASVLGPAGLSIHSCPNYSIPFEPHFRLPLVPGRPRWTATILPSRISGSGLWRSLNFIRAADVERSARDLRLQVVFRQGALATSLDRLSDDPEFRDRHRLIARLAPLLRRLGITGLMRRLPPRWSTPMDFCLGHQNGDRDRLDRWRGAGDRGVHG